MIEFENLEKAIFRGAVRGLSRGSKVVATRAKARAPVRNLFGRGYSFRPKSAEEFAASVPFIRPKTVAQMMRPVSSTAESAFGDTVAWERYRTVGTKRIKRDWRDRRVGQAEAHLMDYEDEQDSRAAGAVPVPTFLTRRGAYEVRHMRATFKTWGVIHHGGRLRGEITATGASVTGDTAEAWVISPTPYARYQEFGTRHNRAHPFLRPALMESQAEVVAMIAEAVAEASKAGGSSIELEVVVRL